MKPKIDESLYKQLRERVQSGAPVDDLLEKYRAYDIRNLLEEAQAMEVGNRDVRDLYEKPEVFNNVKRIMTSPNMKDFGSYSVDLDPEGKPIPKSAIINLKDKADLATKGHEFQHVYDAFSNPEQKLHNVTDVDDNTVRKALELGSKQDIKGMEGAIAKYADHFKPEGKIPKLKQLLNFERLVKGQPLKMLAPVAVGASLMGASKKAMAGDLTGASKEVGQVGMDVLLPDIIRSESVNTNEEELLDEARRKNETPEMKRFNKIRNIIEGR